VSLEIPEENSSSET